MPWQDSCHNAFFQLHLPMDVHLVRPRALGTISRIFIRTHQVRNQEGGLASRQMQARCDFLQIVPDSRLVPRPFAMEISMKCAQFMLFLLLCCSDCVFAAIHYEEVDLENGREMLSVETTNPRKTYAGPEEDIVQIIAVKDFNQDGIDDALVSAWNGGTCCTPEFSVVSVVDGKLVVAAIDVDAYELTVEKEQGHFYIRDTQAHQAQLFAFDGVSVTVHKKIHNLEALVEIDGPGGLYIDEVPPAILDFDVDDDGENDTIQCDVWTRWGSLRCRMPLPDGGTQVSVTGCDRVGVLSSTSNGYHEFVCNFDTVITFNGEKWIEKDDPKRREF
jgi:hypothetical protein